MINPGQLLPTAAEAVLECGGTTPLFALEYSSTKARIHKVNRTGNSRDLY
jgi:hypothetical protein